MPTSNSSPCHNANTVPILSWTGFRRAGCWPCCCVGPRPQQAAGYPAGTVHLWPQGGDDGFIILKQQEKMLSGPFWRQARPGQDSRRADLWLLCGVAGDGRPGVTAPEESEKAATLAPSPRGGTIRHGRKEWIASHRPGHWPRCTVGLAQAGDGLTWPLNNSLSAARASTQSTRNIVSDTTRSSLSAQARRNTKAPGHLAGGSDCCISSRRSGRASPPSCARGRPPGPPPPTVTDCQAWREWTASHHQWARYAERPSPCPSRERRERPDRVPRE